MGWSDWLIPSTSQTEAEAQAHLAQQEAAFKADLDKRRADGTITDSQYYADLSAAQSVHIENQDAAAAQGFVSGLGDGLNNVTTGIHDTLAGTINALWGAIPWQLLVIGGIALFIYLGGIELLKRKVAKA